MVGYGSERDRLQVIAAAEEETSAIATGDAERYFAILTDDAVFMPPNSLPKTGEELRQWLREFLSQVAVEYLQSVHGQTVVSGDLLMRFDLSTSLETTGQPTI